MFNLSMVFVEFDELDDVDVLEEFTLNIVEY